MATEVHTPNLARDLARIHKVITRGLATGIEQGSLFKRTGFSEAGPQQGFCDYSRSLATVLRAHHQAEDAVAFPAFQEKIPQAPYEHLAAQHEQIEALLVSVYQDVNEIDGSGDGVDQLVKDFDKITKIWEPHIRMEESIFSSEALSEALSPSEQGDLAAKMGKFSSEHSIPPYLVVPFVLFNLNSEDRAEMMANLPPTMMNDLILKTWKDQWAPMKPFLIE